MAGTDAAILDAAYGLYVRDGVGGVSMRRVAAALGITATALYRHYESKDDLISAIAERGFELFAALLARRPVARSSVGRILQILDRYRIFALRQPELFHLMFSTPRRGARRFPPDFAAHRSSVFDELRGAVEKVMAEGTFRKADPLEVSLSLWAEAHGLVALHEAGRFTGGERRFSAMYRRLLTHLIGGL